MAIKHFKLNLTKENYNEIFLPVLGNYISINVAYNCIGFWESVIVIVSLLAVYSNSLLATVTETECKPSYLHLLLCS